MKVYAHELAIGDIVEVPHLGKRTIETVTKGLNVCLEFRGEVLHWTYQPDDMFDIVGFDTSLQNVNGGQESQI